MGMWDTLREFNKGPERRFTEQQVGNVARLVTDLDRRLRTLEETTKAQARAIARLEAERADRPD